MLKRLNEEQKTMIQDFDSHKNSVDNFGLMALSVSKYSLLGKNGRKECYVHYCELLGTVFINGHHGHHG